MKLRNILIWALSIATLGLLSVGCTADSGDELLVESGYGYAQFKLYKHASYTPAEEQMEKQSTPTRATDGRLDYLREAYKVQVTLGYDENYERTIIQTLTLANDGSEVGEWGLRSDKIKLLVGAYKLHGFVLYDAEDNSLGSYAPTIENTFEVVEGGLTVQDITVDVPQRGLVSFRLVKAFEQVGKAATTEKDREYTFDEIEKANITLKNQLSNESVIIRNLPCEFEIDYTEDGNKTSHVVCDSLVWLPAGDYVVSKYETFTKNGILLESTSGNKQNSIRVKDNQISKVDVNVTLHEADLYIQDYYALKAIWESLDGPNWSYFGEDYATGANWNFENRDVDLWGDQPGVMIHSNGRVARIDLSNFGFSGDMSPEIGRLTELVELYLGTHNDHNDYYDPTLDKSRSVAEKSAQRLDLHGEWLRTIHVPVQMSEPIARALAEHNIEIPEVSLYKTMKESEIFDTKSGKPKSVKPMDTIHGTICNGLRSLPSTIGNLTKLQYLYIANSTLASLPAEVANLASCTDLEIYNCPNMKEFPVVIGQMPELVSINISNNRQWSPEECYKGIVALANGPSKEKIQILYARENRLREVPEDFKNFKKIGLVDLAYNEIEVLHPWGKDVAPVQLYLDNNRLTTIPHEKDPESGLNYFCGYDDVETFSVNSNLLTKVPNIFSAKSLYTMASVSFVDNQITGFEGEDDGTFQGLKVGTLSLRMNPLKKFPTCLAESKSTVDFINASLCQLTEIPKTAFKDMVNLTSMDLSYNYLTDLPRELHAGNLPYLYGIDLSYNAFSEFPYEPLDCASLTVFALRSQRNSKGERTLSEWPTGIYQHFGLRGLYLGSNDLRVVDDTISTLCYYLDISDNPNIIFDAKDICYAWQVGAYILLYDKSQNILNCPIMLE